MAEKKSVLTLTLGSQRAGMARFGIGGKGSLLLKEYAFAEMQGDPTVDGTRRAALTQAVRQLSATFKADGADVNYAVPGQYLIAKFVKLPPLAEDQVDKIVGFEAQQAVPFPLAETVWDYQLMGKNQGEVEVGIVAIRSEHLNDLNAAVEGAGLETHAVDAAPVALYNAFRYNYPEAEGCSLLVDLGARTTNLVFIEGRRAYISSFQTGGASLTQSIAKEMETDFETAEQHKVASGFVHLGGNYADHEDPQVDAMSKILRNALSRIHNEITRRSSAYRQQQGGAAPSTVYLAGAGASLPFVKEVFEERLKVPTVYFNPLKNVAVGPKVDVEAAGRDAHTLGEMVGLALREMACPMELDLAPHSVQARRDVGNRKPFLMTAAAALAATLGGVWFYNSRAESAYKRESAKMTTEINGLNTWDRRIKDEEAKETQAMERLGYLRNAVEDQKYWVGLLNTLNHAFVDDQIWLTQISPVTAEGVPVTASLYENAELNPFGSDVRPTGGSPREAREAKKTVAGLHLVGINREPDPEGNGVYNLFRRLLARDDKSAVIHAYADFDPNLSVEKLIEKHVKNEVGTASTQDGYPFHIHLPLKRKIEVKPQAGSEKDK